jgi:FKBP-type peptidyl-prolyl cis-trans isomerase FklB
MNPKWLAIVIMFFSALAVKAQDKPSTTPKAPEPVSMTEIQKYSYGIGAQVGTNYLQYKKDLDLNLDLEMLVKGLKDSYTEVPLILTAEEAKDAYARMQKDLQRKAQEKLKIMAEKNKIEGDAFLKENQTKPGVLIIPNSDGVQYRVITPGTGPIPAKTDVVLVKFSGKMANAAGKEFENTKEPVKIPLGKLNNPGLKAALLKMQVGSEWEVVVPAEAAYKDKGNGRIEPNATLIFDITLMGREAESESSPPIPPTPPPTPPPAPNN